MEIKKESKDQSAKSDCRIEITKNGPYIVYGNVPIMTETISCGETDTPTEWLPGKKYPSTPACTLCRCGQSANKPFCDGTHAKINFDGTETADQDTYMSKAEVIDGPELKLTDYVALCASARFCHRGGDIWQMIPKTNEPGVEKTCEENSFDCPSGRLVVWDKKTGKPLEPTLEKSIGLIEDPKIGVSGPLWVRGGIPVRSSNGKKYEVRNRITLCRCGKSTNKPFCDSSHYPEDYQEVKKDEQT